MEMLIAMSNHVDQAPTDSMGNNVLICSCFRHITDEIKDLVQGLQKTIKQDDGEQLTPQENPTQTGDVNLPLEKKNNELFCVVGSSLVRITITDLIQFRGYIFEAPCLSNPFPSVPLSFELSLEIFKKKDPFSWPKLLLIPILESERISLVRLYWIQCDQKNQIFCPIVVDYFKNELSNIKMAPNIYPLLSCTNWFYTGEMFLYRQGIFSIKPTQYNPDPEFSVVYLQDSESYTYTSNRILIEYKSYEHSNYTRPYLDCYDDLTNLSGVYESALKYYGVEPESVTAVLSYFDIHQKKYVQCVYSDEKDRSLIKSQKQPLIHSVQSFTFRHKDEVQQMNKDTFEFVRDAGYLKTHNTNTNSIFYELKEKQKKVIYRPPIVPILRLIQI